MKIVGLLGDVYEIVRIDRADGDARGKYEVMRNGTQVNPLKVKQAPSAKLTQAELKRFETEVARIDSLRADLARSPQVASTTTH